LLVRYLILIQRLQIILTVDLNTDKVTNATHTGDVTGAGTIGVGNLTVSDNATPGAGTELSLTTGSQAFTPGADLAVGASLNIWYYIDIPLGQAQGVYDTAVLEWVATDST